MHDPSTAGVHSADDDNMDNLENDPIAADDEVPYAEYPDEPGEEDPDEDLDGNDIEDPDPDEDPYGGFNDFDDPFDNDLDPFEGEVIDLEPEPNIKVEMVSEEEDLEEEEVAPVAAPRCSSWQKKKPAWLVPSLSGQIYEESANMNVQHPDAHLDFNAAHVMHIVMTQLSMKAGMKHWGERGTGAVSKELQQLHHQNTFEPVDPKMMMSEDFHEALKLHLFLKQKCDDSIKGRMVTDGSKQHTSIMKEDATSPTVALESVLLMAMIDAAEGWDVATIDILNAFVQTRLDDNSDKVLMRLRGKLTKLMVKVAPEIYSKYVSVDSKGELVLYVHLLNALYGIMKVALLYYKCFVRDITVIGFKLNPYDPCVANKIVHGKQLTIAWHVDDLKVSHKKYQVVSRMVKWLKAKYEQLFEDSSSAMTITHGKIHDYLGMQLDFSMPGEVKVTMIPYVKEIVTLFEQYDNSTKTAKTPASEFLFKMRKDVKVLLEKQVAIFHTFVVKNLFASKRAQPDISVAVAFLCT